MTTKKKGSKAKSKNTAKKQILTPVEQPIAETPVEQPIAEAPVEQPKPVELTGSDKLTFMVHLLSRPEGATLKEMAEALGWKENSVRGAMSLYAKNHPEYTHSSEKVDGVRTYRLTKNGD